MIRSHFLWVLGVMPLCFLLLVGCDNGGSSSTKGGSSDSGKAARDAFLQQQILEQQRQEQQRQEQQRQQQNQWRPPGQ